MRITTKQLLKFLPIDINIRNKVLENCDSYQDDQKLALEKFCWELFYEIINMESRYEFEKTLEKAKDGNINLDPLLYQKIESQLYKKFMRDLMDLHEYEAISDIRKNLKSVINSKIQTQASFKTN